MPRRGLILLAGTLAGTLTCGAATSQTAPGSVLNNQVRFDDLFTSQTLNVETASGDTVAGRDRTANTHAALGDGRNLDVRSNQTANGAVGATTILNVGSSSGARTTLTTMATGNSDMAGTGGAVLTGVTTQRTGATTIAAASHIEAPQGETGAVDSYVQAQGNTQDLSASAGAMGYRVNQANAAQVTSDGGGVYGSVSGGAQFQAQTIANNITYNGDSGSAARIATRQTNDASLTQAAQFTAYGQVQDGLTTANAAGNNVSAVNDGYLLAASVNQQNHAYVRAQAETSAAAFGSVGASANGVGNSAILGDMAGRLVLDNTQVNDGGGIEVLASAVGGDGDELYANATAAGNSVVGYACSQCSGKLNIGNNQTNSADVSANATTTATGGARSVSGLSSAVGNSATFYVSRPSGQ